MTIARRKILATATIGASAVVAVPAVSMGDLLSSGSSDADQAERLAALKVLLSAPHPDAELLALGREFEAAWANERHLAGAADTEEKWEAAVTASGAIVDRIATIPAATLTGLKVKARAILWCSSGYDEPGPEMFGSTTELQLAGTIIRDLMTMGGAA